MVPRSLPVLAILTSTAGAEPSATLTGRVLLDGRPVSDFALIVSDHPKHAHHATPTVVHAKDGQFKLQVDAGQRGLAIVGAGFARHTIENITVAGGEVRDLKDIVVDRGHSLSGKVVDAAGRAVAGAIVTVYPLGRPEDDEDPIEALVRDEIRATTDAAGRYHIDGIIFTWPPRIFARRGDQMSPDRELADTDAIVDIPIGPTGVIAGTIRNMVVKPMMATATPITDSLATFFADIDDAGAFRFARLPPGSYDITLIGKTTLLPVRVKVAARETARPVLALPANPINVMVHVNGSCKVVGLYAQRKVDRKPIELQSTSCETDVALLEQVAPGTHRLCVDIDAACFDVVIEPSPAIQSLELTR